MTYLKTRGHYFVGVLALCLVLAACGGAGGVFADSPDEIVNKQVGEQNRTYLDNQPIPSYEYSAQRDIVIQLYNITIPNLVDTWTVFYENNTATDLCKSRGYPLPYGVQLTSPEYMNTNNVHSEADSQAMPQPEPNGLYTNDISTSASWVLCDYGQGIEAVYAEGNVRSYAHPVKMHYVQEVGQDGVTMFAAGQVEHLAGAPSVVLDLSRTGSASGNIDPNTPHQN